MIVSAFRNRLKLDTAIRGGVVEQLHGGLPFWWNGSCVQFELGLFRKETLIDDLSNLAELRIEVKELTNLNGDALMSQTLLQSDLNNDLTLAQWKAQDEEDCHAKVFFPADETDLDLGVAEQKTFWLVITAKRTDGQPITLGCSKVTVAEDGSSLSVTNPSSGNFRFNLGYPELKFEDGTWHRFKPTFDQDIYFFDVEQNASAENADFVSDHWRTNEGYPELLYPDASWHRLLPVFDQAQYLLDVDQAASGSFTSNSDNFRVRLGFPELKFDDDTWHRLKPVLDQGQYTIDIEQTASV